MKNKTLTELEKNKKLSEAIIAEIGKGKTVKEAIDTVFGKGTFQRLSDSIWERFRKEKKP